MSAPVGSLSSPLDMARAAYRGISLYAPERSPCAIDLSDNTNLFGVPPVALSILRRAEEATISRYPSLYALTLKGALAAYREVDPSQVVTGCGSDDVLDSAIRAFAEPGDLVAHPDPSFAMIPLFARMNGLRAIGVPLRPNYDIDAEGLLATGARIIYICSPNNPTGTCASEASIRRVLEEATGLVILDEAYAEFSGRECLADVAGHANLLVVRTLSKAFGLAGLRIGYATGRAALVSEVEKSRGPYKVNALAEPAGVAALTEDREWVARHVATAVRNRESFAIALRALGLYSLPSSANFVLVPISDARTIAAHLRRAEVAVRPMTGLPLIGDALRISIGPWPMMERALAALRDAVR